MAASLATEHRSHTQEYPKQEYPKQEYTIPKQEYPKPLAGGYDRNSSEASSIYRMILGQAVDHATNHVNNNIGQNNNNAVPNHNTNMDRMDSKDHTQHSDNGSSNGHNQNNSSVADPSSIYRLILGQSVENSTQSIGTDPMGDRAENLKLYSRRKEEVEVEVDVCTGIYNLNGEDGLGLGTLNFCGPIRKKKKKPRRDGAFVCKVCNKTFTQLVNLGTHERIHTGERPFRCDVCMKTFTQQPNLWKHLKTHTGEKPYNCGMCDKSFAQRANLVKHIRTHTGERPYPCKLCGKRFTQQANLVKHNRLHSGERPYACRYCTKTFIQQSNLDRHERVHTGVKPYTCKVCWKAFAQTGNLTKHELSAHGIGKPGVNKSTGTHCCEEKCSIPVLVCSKTGKILKRLPKYQHDGSIEMSTDECNLDDIKYRANLDTLE